MMYIIHIMYSPRNIPFLPTACNFHASSAPNSIEINPQFSQPHLRTAHTKHTSRTHRQKVGDLFAEHDPPQSTTSTRAFACNFPAIQFDSNQNPPGPAVVTEIIGPKPVSEHGASAGGCTASVTLNSNISVNYICSSHRVLYMYIAYYTIQTLLAKCIITIGCR